MSERIEVAPPRRVPFAVETTAMTRVHALVAQVARSTLPVLVLGETGVGKEIVSAAIHAQSERADKAFVRINCAALPESLLESELFGFERGAFTGAHQQKRGLLETADGGTFLLDEIGELPLTTQAKLLRVLESGEISRLGALAPRTLDVRLVAATNRDLRFFIANGRFRSDLFYRLNGITIAIPPLRQRVAEIPGLARLFLAESAKKAGRAAPILTCDALAMLEQHAWPGNVRELKNVMERALALCHGDVIGEELVLLDDSAPAVLAPKTERGMSLLREDPNAQRRAVLAALAETGGNQRRAAAILGVSRITLMKRLDKYGVKRPRKGARSDSP
jgi:transcriptional regulator with PAS, ATPase and Fis domain